jgi:hypothetical protein
VVNPEAIEKSMAFKSEIPDQSNLLVITKPQKNLPIMQDLHGRKADRFILKKIGKIC